MKFSPLALTLAAGTLCCGQALALGTLVTPAGTHASILRSRTLVVRYPDKIQIVTQIKATGDAPKFGWLIPLTNVNNPSDNGVLVAMANKASLDELDTLTAPQFTGTCNGAPSGESATVLFGDGWQNGQATISAHVVSAPEIGLGDLSTYLAGRTYEVTPEVQTAIDTLHDQNFMFAVVNIDGMPGAGVDPIVKIDLPLAAGTDAKLGLAEAAATLGSDRIDMVVWTLDASQMKGSLRTKPFDFSGVEFISNDETNYDLVLPNWLNAGPQNQTQTVVLEYGAPVEGFDTAELDNAASNSGATYLTRLRASFLPVAATSNKTLTLKALDRATDYPREHELPGRGCAATPDAAGTGGTQVPDAAVEDAGTGSIPDAAPHTDGGISPADAGADSDASGGGGGGGGGCQVGLSNHGTTGLLAGAVAAFLLSLNTLGRRRRRPPTRARTHR